MIEYRFLDCVDIVGRAPAQFDGEKVYVSTGALQTDHIDYGQTEIVTFENRPSRANLSAEVGDVLFAKMQATAKTLVIDDKTQNHIYSTGFCAVRAKKEVLNGRCLYHIVSGEDFLRSKDQNCSGATQKAITNAGLAKIRINLPPIDEQKSIASQLDTIDKAISQCRSILDVFDATVKSRFIEMFGDPTDNPYGWDKIPLGERCDIVTGNTPSRADPENYGDFLEWIKSDNINTPSTFLTKAEEYLSEVGFAKCRYVESGSVLMTCIAGSINCIGNVAVANRRVAFNQQINAIVPDEDEPLYIYWLMMLSKPFIQSTVNMALKGILSKSKLAALAFPFPPIAKQREFVSFVEAIDKSKLVVLIAIRICETMKQGGRSL